jgi:hypothetical protein
MQSIQNDLVIARAILEKDAHGFRAVDCFDLATLRGLSVFLAGGLEDGEGTKEERNAMVSCLAEINIAWEEEIIRDRERAQQKYQKRRSERMSEVWRRREARKTR